MSVEALLRALPAPADPVEARGDWAPVEASLGTPLPEDYKAFVARYGSGAICDFLTVLNPFSLRANLELVLRAQQQIEALRSLRDDYGEELPFPLFPQSGGLLPVAMTDNGDVIHWLTRGDPEAWEIVVTESRGPDHAHVACDLTTFLAGLVAGTLTCHVFPASAFADEARFSPI